MNARKLFTTVSVLALFEFLPKGAVAVPLHGSLGLPPGACLQLIDNGCLAAQNPQMSNGQTFVPAETDASFSPTRNLSGFIVYAAESGQINNATTDVTAFNSRLHLSFLNIPILDFGIGASLPGPNPGQLKSMGVNGSAYNAANAGSGCIAYNGGDPALGDPANTSSLAYYYKGSNVIVCQPPTFTGTYHYKTEGWDTTDWGGGTGTASTFEWVSGNANTGTAITDLSMINNRWQCKSFTNANGGQFLCDITHEPTNGNDSGFVKLVTASGSRATDIVMKYNTVTGPVCNTQDLRTTTPTAGMLWIVDGRGQNQNVDSTLQPSSDVEYNAFYCFGGDIQQSGQPTGSGGDLIYAHNYGEFAIGTGVHGEWVEQGGFAPNRLIKFDGNLWNWTATNSPNGDLTAQVYFSQGSSWGMRAREFDMTNNVGVTNKAKCTNTTLPMNYANQCVSVDPGGGASLFSGTFAGGSDATNISGNVMDNTNATCFIATSENPAPGNPLNSAATFTVDGNGNLLVQGSTGGAFSFNLYWGRSIGGGDATGSKGAHMQWFSGNTTANILFYAGPAIQVGSYIWDPNVFPGPTFQAQITSYTKSGTTGIITVSLAPSTSIVDTNAFISNIPLNNDGSFRGFRIKPATDAGSLTTYDPMARIPVTWSSGNTVFDTGAGNPNYHFQINDTVNYVQPSPNIPSPSGGPVTGTITAVNANGHQYTVNVASNGNGAIQHINPRSVTDPTAPCLPGIDSTCGVLDIGGGLAGSGITLPLPNTAFTMEPNFRNGITVNANNYDFKGLSGTPHITTFNDILTKTNLGQKIVSSCN